MYGNPSYRRHTNPVKQFVSGNFPLKDEDVTIPQGHIYAAGTVLGRIGDANRLGDAGATFALGAFVAGPANTGNATMVLSGTGIGAGQKDVGDVTVVYEGEGLWTVTSATGRNKQARTAVLFDDLGVKFTPTAGATPAVAGDTYKAPITATENVLDGQFVLSLAAAVDGSEVPDCVLAVDVDTTDRPKVMKAYIAGGMISNELVYGAGHTAASVKAAFRIRRPALFLDDEITAD
jgi:hypothetical protein